MKKKVDRIKKIFKKEDDGRFLLELKLKSLVFTAFKKYLF